MKNEHCVENKRCFILKYTIWKVIMKNNIRIFVSLIKLLVVILFSASLCFSMMTYVDWKYHNRLIRAG